MTQCSTTLHGTAFHKTVIWTVLNRHENLRLHTTQFVFDLEVYWKTSAVYNPWQTSSNPNTGL